MNANRLGWNEVKPAVIKGHSGIDHHFAFIAQKGENCCSFDIYDKVTEIEILRTFTKKIDTGVPVTVVCVSGWSDKAAQSLAKSYGMEIIGANEIPRFFEGNFSSVLSGHISARKPSGSLE